MALCDVVQPGSEATPDRERSLNPSPSFLLAPPEVHGFAQHCGHRATGSRGVALDVSRLLVSDLKMHTSHAREDTTRGQ